MKYFCKTAIGVTEQLALLQARGLLIHDERKARCLLESVGFFRLSPYMLPFQRTGDTGQGFLPGSSFCGLTRLYEFDRKLRLLVMDAIERVEVAIRAAITHHMAPAYGTHWYTEPQLFQREYRHQKLLNKIIRKQADACRNYQRECHRIDLSKASSTRKEHLKQQRMKDSYSRHYALTYSEPPLMPAWAVMEEISFGELSHLYAGLAKDGDKKAIARRLALPGPLVESWLHSLNAIRNICAHHARLWNRELGIRPELPKRVNFLWPRGLSQQVSNTRVFTILCILNLLMRRISPDTDWGRRLHSLIGDFPETHLISMGFPTDWYKDPFWAVSEGSI